MAGRERRSRLAWSAFGPTASGGERFVTTESTERSAAPSGSLRAAQGAPHARILGVGGYRPSRIVTNEEICTSIDSSDEWIRTRSGIATRRWAGPDDTLEAMATAAASKALAAGGVAPEQVGCVILATVSHLTQTPALAPVVATGLGTRNAAAFDINAGCAAFCYGLELAQGMV